MIPTIGAACRIAAQRNPALISGGIGHSTAFYIPGIGSHRVITPTGRRAGQKRAFIPQSIAREFWRNPDARLWIEDRSTNCGENARVLAGIMLRNSISATGRMLVVRNPTMQRRTMATFARVCRDEPVSPPVDKPSGLRQRCTMAKRELSLFAGNCGLAVD